MSLLLDRLAGYDPDVVKLPIHQFVDALWAFVKGWPGAPTQAEIVAGFNLTGPEQVDAQKLINLVTSGTRTRVDIESALRLAELYPQVINKARLAQMLGV